MPAVNETCVRSVGLSKMTATALRARRAACG